MNPRARQQALYRNASDIKAALGDAGADNGLPSSLALALKSKGMLDDLLRTKAVVHKQCQVIEHAAELLATDWSVDLELFSPRRVVTVVRSELRQCPSCLLLEVQQRKGALEAALVFLRYHWQVAADASAPRRVVCLVPCLDEARRGPGLDRDWRI
eukprot:356137-Pleurochrysis_carterae.AAC.2